MISHITTELLLTFSPTITFVLSVVLIHRQERIKWLFWDR